MIKWEGWPTEANTWEPVENLDCEDLLIAFHKEYVTKLNDFMKARKLKWPQVRLC